MMIPSSSWTREERAELRAHLQASSAVHVGMMIADILMLLDQADAADAQRLDDAAYERGVVAGWDAMRSYWREHGELDLGEYDDAADLHKNALRAVVRAALDATVSPDGGGA